MIRLTVLTTEPFHKFCIPAKTEEYEPDSDNGLKCNLVFTYTSKYPDEKPHIEIEECENFVEGYEKELLTHLEEQVLMNKQLTESILKLLFQAIDNIGMVMIFTLVSAAQEWLNVKWDEMKKFREEEESKRLKELEELERVCLYGVY